MTGPTEAVQLDFFDLLEWVELPALGDPAWAREDRLCADRDFLFAACHEAGHAVANACAGRPPIGLWVQRHGFHSGMTWNDPLPMPPAQQAISHLAGMAAEVRCGNLAPWPGGRTDILRVRILAEELVGPKGADELARSAWAVAWQFMGDPAVAAAVWAVRSELVRTGLLTRLQLLHILARDDPDLPALPYAPWPSAEEKVAPSRKWPSPAWVGSPASLRWSALAFLLAASALVFLSAGVPIPKFVATCSGRNRDTSSLFSVSCSPPRPP